ncbi:MAG: TraU family protein, partial [Candidatus Aenigmatarchaeota archaeon]
MRKILSVLIFILVVSGTADAKCKSSFINPLTDICYQCLFPFVIGGVKIIDSDIKPDLHGATESPVCVCHDGGSVILGLRAGFFEPARIVETVKDPYCFLIISTELSNPEGGFLGGSSTERAEGVDPEQEPFTFAQAHWYIFPAFAVIDLLVDFPCFEEKSFDIAYFTEIDPMWNEDMLTLIINPEALLFANPVAQLSCIADSVATSVAGEPINQLFWCMGSWGSAYPLSGHIWGENLIEANASVAARMIYKLGREALLWDKGSDVCGAVMSPIWKKNHYRMHSIKPVQDNTCHPIGKTSLLWGSG